MFSRVLLKLKPPPKLTVSEWADKYRRMSPEASAGTGRWHTDSAPYQREIMDAIGDPHIRMVVFKSSSQVGKTEVLLNVLGYDIDYTPAPTLVLQPTVEMGQTFSKDRLAPMIRDTPVLRKKMDAKSRFAGNTIMQKLFPGGAGKPPDQVCSGGRGRPIPKVSGHRGRPADTGPYSTDDILGQENGTGFHADHQGRQPH